MTTATSNFKRIPVIIEIDKSRMYRLRHMVSGEYLQGNIYDPIEFGPIDTARTFSSAKDTASFIVQNWKKLILIATEGYTDVQTEQNLKMY